MFHYVLTHPSNANIQ